MIIRNIMMENRDQIVSMITLGTQFGGDSPAHEKDKLAMVDLLNDPRCYFMVYGNNSKKLQLSDFDPSTLGIFMCPRFLHFFDINHFSDYAELFLYVNYAALQLGHKYFFRYVGLENIGLYPHDPIVKFQCMYEHQHRHCPAFILFRRRDPYDEKSNYFLEMFDPVHEHDMQYGRYPEMHQPKMIRFIQA